ncbi:dynein beta chain, ciliary-like [Stegodyphus dumicola]|uniref:dynein beta chain, ciliary-like n=1 Tax=Stegodyphus dumicola TaxID=202533 RepID=UPI0015A92A76|nr:dynein beta chain, ciliary-like [Stegodyphus dumicola]
MSSQLPESEDLRIDHIRNVTLQLLDIDHSFWVDFIWKEENQAIIKDFLDSPTTVMLLAFCDRNGKLRLSVEMPERPPMPNILAFFLKHNAVISVTDCKAEISFGNIYDKPLNHYYECFEKVICPIFCNPLNNERWPKEIADDIALHFQNFQKSLTYHIGLAHGKTILMIPETARQIANMEIENISCENTDWKHINSITEMLKDWIPIITEILELTPEHILSKVDQGPLTEITFWNDRKNNLEFIYLQVNDPIIQKMVSVLEKTNNHHFPKFKKLLQDVAEGLDEAREICSSLSEISPQLQALEACDFDKLIDEIPAFIKSPWIPCKYYRTVPSRISVLLKKICNLIIEKILEFLNPLNLFKEDRKQAARNVKLSVDVINTFLKSYSNSHEVETQCDEMYPWKYPDSRIFTRFEAFVQRLNEINEIFEAADTYFSIPSHKIVSIRQATYRVRLEDIFNTFSECYKVFEESSYNPLDLKSTAFVEDYGVFYGLLQELDHKLGILVGQACITCVSTEDAFKLMNVLSDLTERPLAKVEFKKLISSLTSSVYVEVLSAKENYDKLMILMEGPAKGITYKNLPIICGAIQWSEDLQNKLFSPIESFQKIEDFFKKSDDVEVILKTYQDIKALLTKFQTDIIDKWKEVLSSVEEKLDCPLLLTDDKNCVLLNFNPQIADIVQEIRYIKQTGKNNLLPNEALIFDEKSENLLLTRSLLACSVRWFNDLTLNLSDYEKNLISEQWQEIKSLLEKGYSEKWTNNDSQDYAKKLYAVTKTIFDSVKQAKENVKNVQEFIQTWSKIPIYVRETPTSLADFAFYTTPRLRQQINFVIQTAEIMDRVLDDSANPMSPPAHVIMVIFPSKLSTVRLGLRYQFISTPTAEHT